MRNNSGHFDFIIYGASLWGITAAAKLAETGKSVILVNHFGFPGGSLTESLNCVQKLNERLSATHSGNIAGHIIKCTPGPVNFQNESFFIDPENTKIILQNYLESMNIQTLFHVKAHALEYTENKGITLILAGKEGSFPITGRKVIDATEDNFLAAVSDFFDMSDISVKLNLIVSGEFPEAAGHELYPEKIWKISDKRFWLSFNIPENDNNSAEAEAQITIGRIDSALNKFGSRIQVLPASLHRTASAALKENAVLPSDFLIFRFLLDNQFKTNELFSAASEAELNIEKITE